jgi:threonine 3-dehydrogenase
MKALITGGTGLIGSEVARRLVAGGGDVVLFDASPNYNRLDGIANMVEVVKGDVGDPGDVLDTVKLAAPDTIFHLAAILSKPSNDDPTLGYNVNVQGTFNLLEAARVAGVPQVVFSSSINVYNLDIDADVIDDRTLQRPIMLYGAAKSFGENLGRYYSVTHGLDFRGIRFQSIVGPGVKSPGVVQYISWSIEESILGRPFTIWAKPDIRTPALYIKDAARALIELAGASRGKIKTMVYIIEGLSPTPSAQELLDLITAKIPGAQLDIVPDPAYDKIHASYRPLDSSNAAREWGWKPRYDLEAAIDDFCIDLAENPGRYG